LLIGFPRHSRHNCYYLHRNSNSCSLLTPEPTLQDLVFNILCCGNQFLHLCYLGPHLFHNWRLYPESTRKPFHYATLGPDLRLWVLRCNQNMEAPLISNIFRLGKFSF
jgi:hypothetical protein